MRRCRSPIVSFLRSEHAATSIEYGTVLALICCIAYGGIVLLGNNANTAFLGVGVAPRLTGGTSSPTPAKSGQTIFSDSFSDPGATAANWTFNNKTWRADDGTLRSGSDAPYNSFAYANNSNFQNGTIALDANMAAGRGFGIMFHLSGDPGTGSVNGYSFQYDAGYGTGAFVLRKWVNGFEINPPISATYAPAGYQWTGTQRHVEVTTVGSQMTATIDGRVVMTANDSTYTSGSVALRLWGSPTVKFDNVSVTTP